MANEPNGWREGTQTKDEIRAERDALRAENERLRDNLAALEGAVCWENARLTVLPSGTEMKEISTEKLGDLFDERNAFRAENVRLREVLRDLAGCEGEGLVRGHTVIATTELDALRAEVERLKEELAEAIAKLEAAARLARESSEAVDKITRGLK